MSTDAVKQVIENLKRLTTLLEQGKQVSLSLCADDGEHTQSILFASPENSSRLVMIQLEAILSMIAGARKNAIDETHKLHHTERSSKISHLN